MRTLILAVFFFSTAVAGLRGQSSATLPAPIAPAEQAIFFKNYTTHDGLPHGLVNLIFEDSRGFIWLSAQTGLARFDGFSFVPMLGEGSSKDVPYAEILSMAEGATGQIWASTNDGRLLRFDGLSTDFSIAHFDSLAPRGFILKTARDSIWLLASSNLIVFQPSKARFSKISWANPVFENDAARHAGLPLALLDAVFDKAENLWLTSENAALNGLYRWKIAENRWAYFPYPTPNGARPVAHYTYVDPLDGAIYCFGWDGGLRRFLPADERWERFRFSRPGVVAVHFMAPKNEREYWLGLELGLGIFDKKSGQTRLWQHDNNDPNSLLPARKTSCCIARNGSVWVGGTGGASCIDPTMQAFSRRDVLPTDKHVSAYFKDTLARRMLWATGTRAKQPMVKVFCANESSNGPGPKPRPVFKMPTPKIGLISFILRDKSRDFYWLGAEKGLFQMDATTFRVNRAAGQFAGKRPFAFAGTMFRSGKFAPDGTLWLGTYGFGVVSQNPKTGQPQQWLPQSNHLGGFFVREMLCDRQGRIWAGSLNDDGLAAFDPAAGRDFRLDTMAAWRQVFRGKTVSGLAEDGAGNIWAGTSAGLARCRLSPMGAFEAEKIGQFSGDIFYMAFDASGWLWMKTNSGLRRFDPRTGATQVFNEKNGLDADLSFGRFYRADDGEFFFGENYRWRAEDIAPKTEAVPQVVVTAVRLFDQPLAPEKWAAPGQMLQLSHRENALVFEFSALNMTQPAACRYHWQLRGLGAQRTTDGGPGEHRATFTNLPPGDYQFEVWADANPSAAHRPPPTVLAFRIEPPFWATWWFRALAAILAVGAAYVFYQNRLRLATAAAKMQQREAEFSRELAEMEIAALRAQMNPHFIFNLLGTLEAFIAEGRKAEATTMLQKFSRLTRMVLENSARPLVPLADDLAALRLYVELEHARFEGAFRVEWDLDETLLAKNPDVPPLLVQPFVENAILHGLRNKHGGDKWLKIKLSRDGDDCLFEVSDNGVGRKQAAVFAQPKPLPRHSLGAKLTERRIQLAGHTAQVAVRDLFDNQADTGTVAALRLPMA